jgi:5'-3' exonuclease
MVEAMRTYHATATRGRQYWLIQVPEIDRATQARHLRELKAMTEDLISVMTGKDPASFEVEYDIRLPESVQAHLKAARELREQAAEAQARAMVEAREAAKELRAQGMPVRDIGKALGISYQRAHQLAASRSAVGRRSKSPVGRT